MTSIDPNHYSFEHWLSLSPIGEPWRTLVRSPFTVSELPHPAFAFAAESVCRTCHELREINKTPDARRRRGRTAVHPPTY
jgi:hypothetical protein